MYIQFQGRGLVSKRDFVAEVKKSEVPKKVDRPLSALARKCDLDKVDPILARYSTKQLGKGKPIGSLVSKSSFALDPNQSDPNNTDTTQEDPTVDMTKTPVNYFDAMRRAPGAQLKTPTRFGAAQFTPMNAMSIASALNIANG